MIAKINLEIKGEVSSKDEIISFLVRTDSAVKLTHFRSKMTISDDLTLTAVVIFIIIRSFELLVDLTCSKFSKISSFFRT